MRDLLQASKLYDVYWNENNWFQLVHCIVTMIFFNLGIIAGIVDYLEFLYIKMNGICIVIEITMGVIYRQFNYKREQRPEQEFLKFMVVKPLADCRVAVELRLRDGHVTPW